MNLCKNCKHWSQPSDAKQGSGVCGKIRTNDGYPEEWPTPSEMLVHAAADDVYGLDIRVYTGPDFGCTLHEPK